MASTISGWVSRVSGGVAGAAVLIGGVTIVSRVVGFGRTFVQAQTVGTDCLSTAYATANQLPTVTYEIVVGGALLGAVVPVLAGRLDDKDATGQIASALLTWVILLMAPLMILLALLAGPIMTLMIGQPMGCDPAQVRDMGMMMLMIFAPQLVLYGVAAVLYGVLNAHRRFLGPQLAPLMSAIVVITAFLVFYPLSGGDHWSRELPDLPTGAWLTLSIGTTLGVAALVVTVIGPLRRLGLRIRPAIRFPEGVAAEVRRLAAAGLAAVIAQQLNMLVVIRLANGQGGSGVMAGFQYAWAIYLVPFSVLAVPIATSAFPSLSGRFKAGDAEEFDRLTARTTRAVLLVSGAAAGALAAVAVPVGMIFLGGTATDVMPLDLAAGIVAFAPGLVGYGVMFHLSRVLYACGKNRVAAVGQVTGWLVAIVAQTVMTLMVTRTISDPGYVLAALGAGSTIGMTAGGAVLFVAVRRARGAVAQQGAGRAVLATVAGGVAAFGAGYAIVEVLGETGKWASAGMALAAAATAGLAFAAVTFAIDGSDMRELVRRGLRRA